VFRSVLDLIGARWRFT